MSAPAVIQIDVLILHLIPHRQERLTRSTVCKCLIRGMERFVNGTVLTTRAGATCYHISRIGSLTIIRGNTIDVICAPGVRPYHDVGTPAGVRIDGMYS